MQAVAQGVRRRKAGVGQAQQLVVREPPRLRDAVAREVVERHGGVGGAVQLLVDDDERQDHEDPRAGRCPRQMELCEADRIEIE